MACTILKWKKFGITNTLPRACHPAKLSNWGRRALVREVIKNLMVTLKELQISSVETGEPSGRTTISAALHQSGLYGSGQTEATPQEKEEKRPLKDAQTMRNKSLWSDETKIELFVLNTKHQVWTNLAPSLR